MKMPDYRDPAYRDVPPPLPETPGSSAKTAIAVTVGAVVGATVLVAAAPVLLPVVGLGAVVAAVSPALGAVIGGWLGWTTFGKK